MHIALLYNPLSGAGKAAREAQSLAARLHKEGHATEPVEVGPGARKRSLDDALQGADLLIVVGGDGTVHYAAMPAARAGTPIYHFPMGTENLFAREFGMNRTHERVLDAIHQLEDPPGGIPPVTHIDAATANGRPFLLMASVGTDANVVHRLSRNRTGSINHLSYFPHIVREIVAPHTRPITVTVDGETLVDHAYATVIVANTRQYALRVDPARHADPADGLLDVVILPGKSWIRTLGWFARARVRRLEREPRALRAKGRRIHIESHHGVLPYQIDGEAPLAIASESDSAPATTPIDIRVIEAAVPVLTAAIPESHPTHARLLAMPPERLKRRQGPIPAA